MADGATWESYLSTPADWEAFARDLLSAITTALTVRENSLAASVLSDGVGIAFTRARRNSCPETAGEERIRRYLRTGH